VIIQGEKTRKATVRLLREEPLLPERHPPIRSRKTVPTAWLELILREGKNRQVRRMTAAVDHPTLRLVRSAIGQLRLKELNLEPGEWRCLRTDQLLLAFEATGKSIHASQPHSKQSWHS